MTLSQKEPFFYEDNMFQVNVLKQDLEKMIREPANSKESDNPIFRTKFDLEKAQREIHILEGYRIATENIDEVIKTFCESKDLLINIYKYNVVRLHK